MKSIVFTVRQLKVIWHSNVNRLRLAMQVNSFLFLHTSPFFFITDFIVRKWMGVDLNSFKLAVNYVTTIFFLTTVFSPFQGCFRREDRSFVNFREGSKVGDWRRNLQLSSPDQFRSADFAKNTETRDVTLGCFPWSDLIFDHTRVIMHHVSFCDG